MNKRTSKLNALQNQIRRLNSRLKKLKQLSTRYAWYRMAIFLTGAALAVSMIRINDSLIWLIVVITLAIFNIAAYYHRRVDAGIVKYEIWLELKERQLARMKLDWANIPTAPPFKASPEHPFEVDLDITGERSLHQLIDISISRNGSQRLRDWLLQTEPDLNIVEARRSVIRELIPLSLFREKLLLNSRLVSKERLDDKKLINWLRNTPASKSLKRILFFTTGLSIVNWTLLILYLVEMIPAWWILSVALYAIIFFMNQRSLATLLDDAVFLNDELKKYMKIFRYLETFRYGKNLRLANLCAPFRESKKQPSAQLRRLNYIATAIGLRMNYVLGLILNALLPWDFYCALMLKKFRLFIAERFQVWLECCFELEALNSLANFAFLNPDYSFPEIIPDKHDNAKLTFITKNLGHPLIPSEQKICNDFSLNQQGEIILITGSNMAGKSTFLRTLGINLCLAYAGAPVNSESLKTSLFRLFTSINVNDSLADGISQFYAEVKRLKALLSAFDRDNASPLFFLIDEIYKGTNNRERLIGSRSFIRALVGKKGLGIVSTHDLELANLAETIPNFKNYHFREDVIDGRMAFDYKLRPAPCPTTNALKIMRMEGLPVEGDEGYCRQVKGVAI